MILIRNSNAAGATSSKQCWKMLNNTWLLHICDYVTLLLHICDMTLCDYVLNNKRSRNLFYDVYTWYVVAQIALNEEWSAPFQRGDEGVFPDSFIYVTLLLHICDMTHSYVWHDSFIWRRRRVPWLVLEPSIGAVGLSTLRRLIHICDMSHSRVC